MDILKLAKNRVECKWCYGNGYTYERNGPLETDYEREYCPQCDGSGALPNPDWLDIFYGRLE